MALIYYPETLGTIAMTQQSNGEEKPRKYTITIRKGNCLAVFLNIYKLEKPSNPKQPWMHQLVNFLHDEKHLSNIEKDEKERTLLYMFSAKEIKKIRLNMYYKESNILLKHFVKYGHTIECYYKEPKK